MKCECGNGIIGYKRDGKGGHYSETCPKCKGTGEVEPIKEVCDFDTCAYYYESEDNNCSAFKQLDLCQKLQRYKINQSISKKDY